MWWCRDEKKSLWVCCAVETKASILPLYAITLPCLLIDGAECLPGSDVLSCPCLHPNTEGARHAFALSLLECIPHHLPDRSCS